MDIEYKNVINTLTTRSVLKEVFTTAEIERFAKNTDFKRYPKDTQIMTEGEPAVSLIFIMSGKVRISSQDHQLAILQEGDIFGESMFSDEGSRIAHATAIEDTSTVVFTVDRYERLFKESPDIALKYKQFFESVYHHNKNKNDKFFYVDTTKYLALIAHDNMKNSLVAFVKQHLDQVNRFPLVATGNTGLAIYRNTGLVLSRKVKSGPLGGDQSIGSMVSTDNIRGIIFFRDPLSPHPHHADIEALGRLCDVYQIPFATNPATAKAVLGYLTEATVENERSFNSLLEKYHNQEGHKTQ